MNKWIRGALLLLLLVIFAVCMMKVIPQVRDYQKGKEDYAEAMEIAGIRQSAETSTEKNGTADGKTYEETIATVDLASLQAVNSDVIGWIAIPDTEIFYPLLRTNDNDYYLNHTWKKEWNSVGSIFMESRINPDFSAFHTIIYGHRMRNGSMFGGLKDYRNAEYWKEHPSVYVVTDDAVRRYDVFAAHEMATDKIAGSISISEDAEKQEFIRYSIQHSAIDTDIVPTEEDFVLSLITCTGRDYSSRWVVQAVLREEVPQADAP